MAIQYMPGLWDSIKPEAMGFVNELVKSTHPDHFAEEKFKQMIQQNPDLINQISNMDDTQRSSFIKAMGFVKNNPVAGLAPGAERLQREQNAEVIKGLSPDERKVYSFGKAGAATQESIDANRAAVATKAAQEGRDATKFGWEKQINDLEMPVNAVTAETKMVLAKQQQRDVNELIELQKKYPEVNIGYVYRAMESGRMDQKANDMAKIIDADPAFSKAMMNMISIQKIKLEARNNFSLRSLSQQDEADRISLGFYKEADTNYKNAMNVVNNITKNNTIAKVDLEAAFVSNPELRAQYNDAVTKAKDAYETRKDFHPIAQKFFAKQGVVIPDFRDSSTEVGGAPPAQETPEQMIASTRAKIAADKAKAKKP